MAVPVSTNAKVWTLDELHSLPDDGNKYELVHGELFVTPPPSVQHEQIVERLNRMLVPFVAANRLGGVYRPRSVIRFSGSEVEPDLMVRQSHPEPDAGWAAWPVPILVVEIISPSTRRRDQEQKKAFYRNANVAEYWIVDPERRSVIVVRHGEGDRVENERVEWQPPGGAATLAIDIDQLFSDR